MPISPNTITDLKETTVQLDFLLSASDVAIREIPTGERKCAICRKVFEKISPVKTDCGHIFDVRCLARLAFGSNFANKCPKCHSQLIANAHEKEISHRSWRVASPLLELLMILNNDLASSVKEESREFLRRALEGERFAPLSRTRMERTMVLLEEFLDQFYNHPASAEVSGPLEAAEREEELRHLRRQLSVRGELAARRHERSEARVAGIYRSYEHYLRWTRVEQGGTQAASGMRTAVFVLCGVVATVSSLGAIWHPSGYVGALPLRIFPRLCFVACVVYVAQTQPGRTTLTMLGSVIVGVIFEYVLAERRR